MTKTKFERRDVEYYEWLALRIEGMGFSLALGLGFAFSSDTPQYQRSSKAGNLYIWGGQLVTINALFRE